MLHLIFNGIQAYNQVGLFFGALICLGIGGLLLGNALYWRVHSLRAQGTIIGVLANHGSYTSVYRYTAQDGQIHEVKSDTGSNSTRGKETGRTVPLLISAHNPTESREANSYLLEIIGAAFTAPGLWLVYTALTAYPITPMTGIMAIALLAYMAERSHRIFVPKGQRFSIEEWKKQCGSGSPVAIDLNDVRPIEEIVPPEAQSAVQRQYQNNKKTIPILGIFAVILIVIGVIEAQKIFRLESSGLRAEGQVVGLKEQYSSSSHGGGSYTYYPIVDYQTADNQRIEFKDNVGSNPPSHHVGDKVTVLYLAGNPQKEAIIDRGYWNWLLPVILIGVAALLLWFMRWIMAQSEKK